MNEAFKVTLPKLGESILSATVVQWFKKPGDFIERDEPLLEVSTDKVNSEIPAPISGVLHEICAKPDEELQVGALLAWITTGKEGKKGDEKIAAVEKPALQSDSQDMRKYYSPALLRLAQEKGVSMEEIEKISGTGEGGRITKRDLEMYVDKKSMPDNRCQVRNTKVVMESLGDDIERVKMSGMRKAIAENMVRSFYQAPHASLITEVDVTRAMQYIQKEKENFAVKHGVKITITSFVARALAKALQEYPLLNSSLEQDTIVVKRFVNLGIAVSIDQGLVVPVIKNCQRLTLAEIARSIAELSQKARSGKLIATDMAEGTITMTNFGVSGVEIGIPIIRFPEVAIIGVGAVQKKVVVREDDSFAICSRMHICLTFDHRVLDGMYGCGFLSALKKHLESDLLE